MFLKVSIRQFISLISVFSKFRLFLFDNKEFDNSTFRKFNSFWGNINQLCVNIYKQKRFTRKRRLKWRFYLNLNYCYYFWFFVNHYQLRPLIMILWKTWNWTGIFLNLKLLFPLKIVVSWNDDCIDFDRT